MKPLPASKPLFAALACAGTLVAATAATPSGAQVPDTSTLPPVPGPVAPPGPPGPAASVVPTPRYRVDAPAPKTLYRAGQDGRYLLGGSWLFRFDRGRGLADHLPSSGSTRGWRVISVPYAWNVGDNSIASMKGTVAWYRKDFRLPPGGANAWIVRFESVNYRSRYWLNGHEIGTHAGFDLPFELQLPSKDLKRGTNHLVVEVDNRRHVIDFPPAAFKSNGEPGGGYWNFGGILREVYLRRAGPVDVQSAQVLSELPCATCPARIRYRVVVQSYSHGTQNVTLTTSFGGHRASLGSARVGGGSSHEFVRTVSIGRAHLWSPQDPYLYDVNLVASANGRAASRYFLRSGVRSIQVRGGLLLLNGRQLNLRGVGLLEDSPAYGPAVDDATRAQWMSEVRTLGATFVRSQYPLHPYVEELADRDGILLWSEIPAFSIHEEYLARSSVLRTASSLVEQNAIDNGSHPSIIVWSIANELGSKPGPHQVTYIAHTVRAAHAIDPTRPVGYAYAASPASGCNAAAYRPLDVLGMNDYFGWYAGSGAAISDLDLLSAYLDFARQCYRRQALIVSEMGAEANRPGPTEERGSYAFQSDYLDRNLDVFDSKPWLSGATWWALREFRVRPGWDGSDPRPAPPIHNKGLITFDGRPKPAYYEAQRRFRATVQLRP